MVMEQQVSDNYGYTGYLVAILMPEQVREGVGKVRDQ